LLPQCIWAEQRLIEYMATAPFVAFPRPRLSPFAEQRRFRPFTGGHSVGSIVITAGTAALKVRDKATDKELVLSNNHVLAMNGTTGAQGPIGLVTLQPGPYDGGVNPGDRIGTLFKVCLAQSKCNKVDAAVSALTPQI